MLIKEFSGVEGCSSRTPLSGDGRPRCGLRRRLVREFVDGHMRRRTAVDLGGITTVGGVRIRSSECLVVFVRGVCGLRSREVLCGLGVCCSQVKP